MTDPVDLRAIEYLPAPRRKRRSRNEAPQDQINIRGAVADLNRFVEWCERNRLTYGAALALLVQHLEEIDPNG